MAQPIDRFYASVARNPDAVAVRDRERAMSYTELASHVDALAAALQSLDPAAGSRVGIRAWNTVEHLIALLATYAAGKVWVPLNPRNGPADLDAMMTATSPSIILTDEAVSELLSRFAGQRPRRHTRGDEDAQIIKFSGGSTGTPKPVVQSLRCINAQADGLRDFFEFDATDVNLVAAPLTHGASCFVLPILEVGGCHVLLSDAKRDAMRAAIQAHGVTTIYAPPTLLYALIDGAESLIPGMQSLRHVIYSAAPMAPARIRACQRALGAVIETAYGQVEAPQIITAMRASELTLDENLESVGHASSVAAIGVMNDAGELLGPGNIGEIVVRGPLLMSGYLDRPDMTAAAIIDGWLHTGDVGAIDERGYLFIRARMREVINTGGFKVFPGDVEASLLRHPDVAECAVFGVPDPKWGEAVHAAVVTHSAVSAEELISFVKSELGSVKAPKVVHFVDHLERNAAGKVSRGAVRAAVLNSS
ncbi:MAG TPA: AMP-binding protein [Gemmatimonadaceae bacterium]|nr:AMP-binding protein [Gemmatimonadaceae bacterium]